MGVGWGRETKRHRLEVFAACQRLSPCLHTTMPTSCTMMTTNNPDCRGYFWRYMSHLGARVESPGSFLRTAGMQLTFPLPQRGPGIAAFASRAFFCSRPVAAFTQGKRELRPVLTCFPCRGSPSMMAQRSSQLGTASWTCLGCSETSVISFGLQGLELAGNCKGGRPQQGCGRGPAPCPQCSAARGMRRGDWR